MEGMTMDNDSALAAQALAWQLSDEGGRFRDPMQPFRDLCRAQADAPAGRSDDDDSPMFWRF
jgi:hypothetical protein